MNQTEILEGLVEVELKNPDNFLIIKETLTRIGVAPKDENRLYQSCHIFHKQKKYYLVHFKELLALDGKDTNFSEEDLKRRNLIASLLEQWNLLKVKDQSKIENKSSVSSVRIVPYGEKQDWQLIPKYTIGKKKTSKE